jgi:hypothetical protein
MSNVILDQSAWEGVVVMICGVGVAVLGEEANVVALGADSYCPLDLFFLSQQMLETCYWELTLLAAAPNLSARAFFITLTS